MYALQDANGRLFAGVEPTTLGGYDATWCSLGKPGGVATQPDPENWLDVIANLERTFRVCLPPTKVVQLLIQEV